MSKRRASRTDPQFDEMGQPVSGLGDLEPIGDDSMDALEPLVSPEDLAPLVEAAMPEEQAPTGILGQLLAEMEEDPGSRRKIFDELSKDPTIRKQMGLGAGEHIPQGEYDRDYSNEDALKVYGGVEVAHDKGFEPLPPSWIDKFVATTGGTTNDPTLADWDDAGKPIKAEAYKTFIDHHLAGTKMDGNVRYDIGAENFVPGDVGVM